MTRGELTTILSQQFPSLVDQDADLAVKVMLTGMANALAQGGRVEIRGFGTFGLSYRQARIARNPKTGEKVPIAARYLPHFRPGKKLRAIVDRLVQPRKSE